MRSFFFHSVFAFLLVQVCVAQEFDSGKLDTYFDTLQAHNKFMGNVAVSKEGNLLYARSLGYTDVKHKIKANEKTKYRIGSVSKTFTAVLVFKAVEEGILDLAQTIDTYFPTLPNAEKITIDQLLNHRSGIHNFTQDASYLSWNTQPRTHEQMLAIIAKGGSDFEPDTQAQYSNSNYVVLSYILEKVFKKPYALLLAEKITRPLDLHNTYMDGPIDIAKNESLSYRWLGNWLVQPETDISIPLGAGGIVSTAIDLVKFSNALFGGKLVSEKSLLKMMALKDNYGRGLFKYPYNDKYGYGHTGGIDGFTSIFIHFASEDVSYALVSNGSAMDTNDISIAVLSAVYNDPFEIPVFFNGEISEKDLAPYLGEYSSKELPLKLSITNQGTTLMAQATGQASFPLKPEQKNVFSFAAAGIVIQFQPRENSLVLKQAGGSFTFTKE